MDLENIKFIVDEVKSNEDTPPPPVIPVPPPPPPPQLATHSFTLSSSNLKSERPKSEDLDLISPYLYIGCYETACNVDYLKSLNITHILSIEDRPLKVEIQKQFTYKYKKLSDFPSSDLLDVLEECIDFIDSPVKNSNGVLVHCYMGLSRSASVVIAYLMAKQNKPLKNVLEFVREARYVRPNPGFMDQLAFFEAMNFKIDKQSNTYKCFKLEKAAKHVNRGGRFSDIYSTDQIDKNSTESSSYYTCITCRSKLFLTKHVLRHTEGFEFESEKFEKRIEYYQHLNNSEKLCDKMIHIEPLAWFEDNMRNSIGKINCLECKQELGSYFWRGCECECGTLVIPTIRIERSKVDFCSV